jgi:D-sedoheptulose 7-phosphate isomerase
MITGLPHAGKSEVLNTIGTIDLEKVKQAIEVLAQTRDEGYRLFVYSNRGYISTASQFVCDMVKGANFRRATPFRTMALTYSPTTITAYSDDIRDDCAFVEHLKNFAQPGRNGGQLGPLSQLNIRASYSYLGRIEDVHAIVIHKTCYYFMDLEKQEAVTA